MSEGRLFTLLLCLSVTAHAAVLALAPSLGVESVDTERSPVEVVFAELETAPQEPRTTAPAPTPAEPLRREAVAAPPPDVERPVAEPETFAPDPFADRSANPAFVPREPAATPAAQPLPATTSPDVLVAYRDVVRAWLNRHKAYPRLAERRGIEGEPLVRITIGRDGAVLNAALERASGHQLLDAAALDMVRRSAPFPPFPDHVREPALEYVIPVTFTLR